MTEPFYRFFVIDYLATGEGRSYWLKICRNYQKIDDIGLHYAQNQENKILEVDNIIICAGQIPLKELYQPLVDLGKKVHVIGGADVASELDAKRAINQGARLAANL